jgi:hypothetical protein
LGGSLDGPCGGDRVELVRVIEDSGLGGPGRAGVVMRRHCVQQFGSNCRLENDGTLFDQPQAEVYVPEEPSLIGLPERGASLELAGATDVMEQRRCNQEICPQARVQLRCLAAECRHPDRVLEQASRVRVMYLGRSRKLAEPFAQRRVREEPANGLFQAGVRDLVAEKVEEAVELVRVAAEPGGEQSRIELRRRLESAHVELKALTEALDAAEHAYGIALAEARLEHLHVAPDPGVDPTAGVDQLEREVRRAGLRAAALLPSDGVDALDDSVLLELGDRGHVLLQVAPRDRGPEVMAGIAWRST